ncbi:MAG: cysteine protease StiP family protein [Deltaproteobacteria bacterium]|jgi:hypothetical protein|nr:cysteine protease StiP family protein [Deltaproteobacteria bacterium]
MTTFSGSYDPQDAIFLLKVVELAPLDIYSRELRIQGGQSHYSEMIGPEAPPERHYLDIFYAALKRHIARLAQDCLKLAIVISQERPSLITLVSIARSGIPVGVVLTRILKKWLNRPVTHYVISVIRDRGVDENALKYILNRRPDSSVVFVDGWTGKGVIAQELRTAIGHFNQKTGAKLDPSLAVLSDLAGVAGLTVGVDDYLIPTCLLNSVVSGLISRTILNEELIGPDDFHGCLFYKELAQYDLSNWLVAIIMERAAAELILNPRLWAARNINPGLKSQAAAVNEAFLAEIKKEFKIQDQNLIKPGLGEATRVLLRRAPQILLVQDLEDPDVAHALALANQRGVPVQRRPDCPYRAAAIIRQLKKP